MAIGVGWRRIGGNEVWSVFARRLLACFTKSRSGEHDGGRRKQRKKEETSRYVLQNAIFIISSL